MREPQTSVTPRTLGVLRPAALVLVALLLGGVGNVVDASRTRAVVGQPSIADAPLSMTQLVTASRARTAEAPLAMRDVGVPGFAVVLDTDGRAPALGRLLLRGLAGAGPIQQAPLGEPAAPERRPDAWGIAQASLWELYRAPGEVETFLVWSVDGVDVVVDARLVPSWSMRAATIAEGPGGASTVRRTAPTSSDATLLRGVLGEGVVLLILLLAGLLVLPRRILPPLARVPMALLVGVAMLATVGLLRLPGLWGLAVVTGLALVTAVLRPDEPAITLRDVTTPELARPRSSTDGLLAIGVWTGLLMLVVLWVRSSGAVFVTPDSGDYLLGAHLLSQGAFDAGLVDLKRGVGQQALHAAGIAVGAHGLQALGAVLLLAVTGLIALLPTAFADRKVAERAAVSHRLVPGSVVLAAAAAVVVLTSAQLRTMAAYVNAHLLVAALLLALVLLLVVATDTQAPGLGVPLAAVVGALVVLRPEGTALVGLVLLGALRAEVPRSVQRSTWTSLGLATIAWNLLLAAGPAAAGAEVPIVVRASLGLGVVLPVVPFVLERLGRRASTFVAVAGLVLLWGVAAALQLFGGEAVRFLRFARFNVMEGYGGWGMTGPVLLVVAVVAIHLSRRAPALAPARWLLLGFVPVTMIAKLGDGLGSADAGLDLLLRGGGRGGWGDSVNRMWTHAALVAVVLLVLALLRGERPTPTSTASRAAGPADPASPAERAVGRAPGRAEPRVVEHSRRRDPIGAVGGTMTAVIVLALVQLWSPFYLPVEPPASRTEVLRVVGDDPIGELVRGAVLEQPILLPASADPSPTSRRAEVCVGVTFATFDRPARGRLLVTVATDAVSAEWTVDQRTLTDWNEERFCLELPEGRPTLEGLRLRIEAMSGQPGEGVTALQASGTPIATLTTPDGSAGAVARPVGPLVLSVTTVVTPPLDAGIGALLSDAVQRWTPLAVALLLLAAVISRASAARRTRRGSVVEVQR